MDQVLAGPSEVRPTVGPASTFSISNEGQLHAAVKALYAESGGQLELPVDGFVIDVVRDDLLIEVQTANFASIKRKLESLVTDHRLLLVFPIVYERWIIQLPEDPGATPKRRKSPVRGSPLAVFPELVSFPHLLRHENFSLDLLFTQEEEIRRRDARRGWRRHGWVTEERRLLGVVERRTFSTTADFAVLLPANLEPSFTVSDLAAALGRSRALAQKMAYCLKKMGVIEVIGKRGRASLYRRVLDGAVGDARAGVEEGHAAE